MEVYFGNLTTDRSDLDKLAEEMETLVQNAEELVLTSGAKLAAPERKRLAELLAQLKSSAARYKLQAVDGFKVTDKVVREYPYQSAGVALVVGLLVGVLVGRAGRDD